MNKAYYFRGINRMLLAVLTTATLFGAMSCNDDSPATEPEYPGNDNFEGHLKEILLTVETAGFRGGECGLSILAPDNSLITRQCTHQRTGHQSTLTMASGLKDGDYRLLYLEYPAEGDERDSEHTTRQYGLGCKITVNGSKMTVASDYDSRMGLSGAGTENNPYIISSYDHLITLAHKVNSDVSNGLITENTHFRQIVDIDMDDACFYTDHRYGWEPIGNDVNVPFRGIYHGAKLSNIWSLRKSSPAIGLFGYIQKAKIDGVGIEDGEFSGNFAVGAIAGAAITSGAHRDRSEITNCRVTDSSVEGSEGSVAVGGILGITDMNSKIMLYECHNENTAVSGAYNVGGVMGAASFYSLSSINNCSNSGRVSSGYSGAGGITGTCDTIYVTSCQNSGEIAGGTSFKTGDKSNAAIGAGGIAGGTGIAFVTGCSNTGGVSGVYGVGGIVGSSRIAGDETNGLYYNNVNLRYCSNYGDVKGEQFVGGINGESQIGTFGVLNQGNVTAKTYVGGIVGNTSIAVAHNSINTGKVSGNDYTGGIIGKTTFGSIALDDNFGEVSTTGHHTGGIAGLVGNNTIIHYCGNHGNIFTATGNQAGGLVGQVGDPREWTGWNVAECVVGVAEIAMSIIGPMIAVVEPFMHGLHTAAMILENTELAIDMALHATDTVLWADGLVGIVSGESSEEVSTAIKVETNDLADGINRQLADIRADESNYKVTGLSKAPLSLRGGFATDIAGWYAEEGNDEAFNDAINETRIERMEEIEKWEEGKEIFHECIAGVCIVAGTVASIGAMVVTGGAAAAFVLVGAVSAAAGGVNAILKTCTEFEANVVVISQCVNSGEIKGHNNAGALIGSLNDKSILRDCLNAGEGPGDGYAFAVKCGSGAEIVRCANVATGWSKHGVDGAGNVSAVLRKDGAGGNSGSEFNGGVLLVDKGHLNDPEVYKMFQRGWDITTDASGSWVLSTATDSGVQYPVPSFSEMRKTE